VNNKEILQRGIAQLNIFLDSGTQEKLLHYLALLVKWNTVYNLTAIRDPRQMVSNHLLDSLAVLPHLWPGKWLDAGCGAGLPGLVLAIAHPDWQFTMVDSNSKKTSFVQQAIIELELKNAYVNCVRVENWHPQEKFDGIISRAFTEIGKFLSVTRHLVSDHGGWAAMKGIPEQELENIPSDCEIKNIIPLHVPGLQAARSLVIATCNGSKTA
jgi:16S rRNA (guanine527-N7)-methyltransferase